MTKLPKKQKKYIDIRLHLSSEIEDFGPDDTYEHFEIDGVERIKIKGIEEDQLDNLAETVAQSDHYQIYLFGAVTTALDTEGVHEL
jgi:hypothetical protein